MTVLVGGMDLDLGLGIGITMLPVPPVAHWAHWYSLLRAGDDFTSQAAPRIL
jgi:hypothetical protein